MNAKGIALLTGLFMILPQAAFSKSVKPSQNETGTASEPKKLSEVQRDIRLQHAQELLGKYYDRSSAKAGETVAKINSSIYKWTFQRLPKKHRSSYQGLAQAIIDESVRYQFDPVFLMSVIQGESSFNPERLGKLDEIGLMQLRPATAQWIAKKYGLKYSGAEDLRNPVKNVKLGAAYLDYLRGRFDSHARLYLAAYNMGQRNVDDALEKKIWPKDYPTHIMKQYRDFYAELKVGKLIVSSN